MITRAGRGPVRLVGGLALAFPLALGSLWGLVFIPLLIWMLAARLIDEESYLIRNLPGYADYCAHVRFRLAPGLW